MFGEMFGDMFSKMSGGAGGGVTEDIDEHCESFTSDERGDMDTYILSWLMDGSFPGALGSGGADLLEELLKTGKCDVTTPAPHGGTAIHSIAIGAADEEALRALTLLLDYHPKLVNTRNNFTETALHFVAMYGNARAARELLKRGADPTLKTYQGKDALALVDKNRGKGGDQAELRAVIRKAQADFKHKCHLPGCDLPASKLCGGCGRARYCGPEHQHEHWKQDGCSHKKLCKTYRTLQAEPEVPECKAM